MSSTHGMPEAHVVGHEIEHQPQAALVETMAEPGQRGVAAQLLVDRVAGDREAGAADVVVGQVRQAFPENSLRHSGLRARDLARPSRFARR